MDSPTPIFENAVDSLTQGIASYLIRDESETAIKHAILTVYHSIELFLKEGLARIHPILIYRNLDKRITDDSPTVGLEEALIRLDNLGRGLSAAEVATLRELRIRRNRIEHHRFDPAKDHAVVVGQAFHFLLGFLPAHLDVELRALVDEEDQYRDLLEAALSFEQRREVAEREATATGSLVIGCPVCGENTLCLEGLYHCYFCNDDIDMTECDGCDTLCYRPEISRRGLCESCAAKNALT
ncbi:MAG: hypothetical protein HYY76_19010 [Acidobacteria bacterium]|nr:hypothetical protein [Acidobacteriota bacterium]